MDRVGAHPAARRVGPLALGLQQHPQRALAAALDLAVRRFQEDREVALEPLGVRLGDVLEAVQLRGDLLVVVEDEGQVAVGGRDRGRDAQLDRDARLHVARAAAPQDAVLVQAGRDVFRDRDGVDVTGQDHPLRAAQVRPRHDVVAEPLDRQVGQRAQRGLDRVRERLLGAALGTEVDEPGGELCGVQREVKRGVGHAVDPNAPGLCTLSTPGTGHSVLSSTLYGVPEPSSPPSVAAASSDAGPRS
ncbi:hypothetical protein SVIOM74S_09504 [Streptomyces violarus]